MFFNGIKKFPRIVQLPQRGGGEGMIGGEIVHAGKRKVSIVDQRSGKLIIVRREEGPLPEIISHGLSAEFTPLRRSFALFPSFR